MLFRSGLLRGSGNILWPEGRQGARKEWVWRTCPPKWAEPRARPAPQAWGSRVSEGQARAQGPGLCLDRRAVGHVGEPPALWQTTSTRLYAGGELQGSPVWQALAGHKRRIPLAASWLSSHGRGLGPRDALQKDSRGRCRGAAGNPRVPRLLPGTLGNFPGCL